MTRRRALRRRYGHHEVSLYGHHEVSLSQPLRVYAQHIVNALVRGESSPSALVTEFGLSVSKARAIAELAPRAGPAGPGFEWAVRKTARIIRRDWS